MDKAKFGENWVARISFQTNNPEHNYVVHCTGNEHFEVYGCDEFIRIHIPSFLKNGVFKLIRKIDMSGE